MRFLSVTFLMMAVISGCRCSPPTPQPVTLRVINTTRSPIYVDGSGGKLGLKIQRDVGGQLFAFDDLACECRFCTNVCNTSCTCPDAGLPLVRRIDPGATAEREWNGVVQTTGYSNCGTDSCLDQQNAPLNEPFTLELCFNVQRPQGARFDDAGVAEGVIPILNSTCTTRQFAPQDLVVEIGPTRGSACTSNADCKGTGELCFDNACTTGCPANEFPQLGSEWVLLVASVDNMGFFEQSARGTDGKQFVGTGTLTSAVYQSSSLLMSFSRPGTVPGEVLTGRVQVKLPAGVGVPITTGNIVKVLVTDDGADVPSRAVLIEDATTSEVLFAADMAQGVRALTDMELAPFSISSGSTAVGCTQDGCGRKLFFPLTFTGGGGSLELVPGQQGDLTVGAARYHFLNVSSGRYETTTCDISDQRPWLFWKVTTP
ncbi:MAG: hypothetical protein JNM17_19130 [Archangium sp.]|nr:hypothetical protein [Archangium sp.]